MTKIGIIGGGINGLMSAYYCQKMGYEVTIIEQGDLLDGCSYGNAGMIVPSHIIPLAAPGMIAKGLRWMLSPTSPFYIRPRMSGRLIKWGSLFYKNSTAAHVENLDTIVYSINSNPSVWVLIFQHVLPLNFYKINCPILSNAHSCVGEYKTDSSG